MKIMKKILAVVILIASILAVGWVGELDHHEYIEANSTRQTKMPIEYKR